LIKLKEIFLERIAQSGPFSYGLLRLKKWKHPLKNIGKNYIMLRYGLTLRILFEQTIEDGSSHVRDIH